MCIEIERIFWSKVNKGDGCWEWQGGTGKNGYGFLQVLVHRLAYELANGPIGPDLVIHHLCKNRICVNPAHLELTSRGINAGKPNKGKTHCPKGHLYDEENTYYDANGHRKCRSCVANRQGRTRTLSRKLYCKNGHLRSEAGIYENKRGNGTVGRRCKQCVLEWQARHRPHKSLPTHCKYGHEYTPENTLIYRGARRCRECNRIRSRETHRKQRAKEIEYASQSN